MVFVDANPSFSIYTQIALSAVDRVVLPVMADDSSRRAIQNAFSLIYGLKLPSEISSTYAFATRLQQPGRELSGGPPDRQEPDHPIHGLGLGVLGRASVDRPGCPATADVPPGDLRFEDFPRGVVDIRDFQTTGVVAVARGCPFHSLKAGRLEIAGKRVQVKEDYRGTASMP